MTAFLQRFAAELAGGSALALGIALLAGIVSSGVCPCTLPLGIGVAGLVGASESQTPRRGFVIAIAFFVGIVTNLLILGALAGRFGALLSEAFGRYWMLAMALASSVGAIVAFWGPRLNIEQLAGLRRPGIVGALGYGFIFSLGTSAAPLLLLLTVAAAVGKPSLTLALALGFGVGRGLPFLLVGFFAGALMRFSRISLWRRTVQIVSGCALIVVSLYYLRNFLSLL